MDEGGAEEIAGRCRGTPRIANRLLRRARDFAEVRAAGRITRAVAQEALQCWASTRAPGRGGPQPDDRAAR